MPNEYVSVCVGPYNEDSSEHTDYDIVSLGPPLVLKHKREKDFFAGRLLELGFTGYGKTPDEARDKVERMFRSVMLAIRTRNGAEGLGRELTRLGVRWEWSEGPEDELKY